MTQKTAFLLGLFLFIPAAAHAEDQGDFNQWQFTWGGEERARVELRDDFNYKNGAADYTKLMHNRLRIGAGASLTDEYLKPKLDVYVEGLDAEVAGRQITAAMGQEDNMDLHQAYVNAHDILGAPVDVKIGREELKYGMGRLIAAPVWANRIRSFDGGVVHYHQDALWADALYGQEVKYDDNNWNRSNGTEFLTGVYGGWQEHKMAPLVETYFLKQQNITLANDIHRYTVGARVQKNFGAGIVAEVELPYQFGQTGTTAATQDISAWAFHADIKKGWEDVTWTPQLALSYDQASGDRSRTDNESNTFVPLYQTTHEPYGLLDLVRWQNIRNPEISFSFSPTDKLKITPQADFFWLDSRHDAWYNTSGAVVRANASVAGAPGSYIGNEVSLRGFYSLTDAIKLETGYAHFTPGGYTRDSGPHDKIDWTYGQVTFKF